jgi:hypothetical protein
MYQNAGTVSEQIELDDAADGTDGEIANRNQQQAATVAPQIATDVG